MKLFLVGATGGTGKALLNQALVHGHDVTVLARRPESLTTVPHLTIRKGDATDLESVTRYLGGHDAVLSTLGPSNRNLGPTTLYSQSAQVILEAMKGTGVRRFIGVTSGGVVDGGEPLWYRLIKPRFKHVYSDMKLMEQEVMASDTEWTLVRPAYLTDARRTGRYRTAVDVGNPPRGWRLSREDVADFMLKILEDGLFVRQAVAIAY